MNRKNSVFLSATVLVIVGVLFSVTPKALALLLVKDGKPCATIVVSPNASSQVQRATRILQQYIEQSSGAKLPIAATANGNAIIVGHNANVDIFKIDQDGFILQGVGKNSYVIVGGSDWGTEFGVYDFLERYLGVRWLMPTDLGIDIPRHVTIDVPDTKIVQQPTFLSRELSPLRNITGGAPEEQWGRFNRARGRVAFHHNVLKLFPVSIFGKDHSEFYPTMSNGKRYLPADDSNYGWQPNFSAPGITDAAVERIEKYFQENPTVNSYSLGMNDSYNWDQSDASKARRSDRKNYLGLEDTSDDYFAWANDVVEKVLLKYPDKWFGTLAYNALAEPPSKVGVNSHIVPFLTYDRMRWEDPKLREFGQRLTQRWANVSQVLGWYDYAYGHSYLLPRVYPHRMQKYLRWGAAHNVKFYYAELYPNWGEGPKAWVLTKLLWNPNQNVDSLLDDWYTHFAGSAAAPKLKAFYAIWEKFWSVDIFKSKWNRDSGQYLPFDSDPAYLLDVPKTYINQADAAMQAALQLADTPQRKARVAKLKEMWEFCIASIITYQGSHFKPQSEAQALAILDKAEAIMTQARKRRELLAAFANDPLYSLTAGYITRRPTTGGQEWDLSILLDELPWVEKSEQVRSRLQELTKSSDMTLRQRAMMVLQIADKNTSLVSSNASFEDGIKGWGTWNGRPSDPQAVTWSASTGQALSGAHSLLIKGLRRGGPTQNIPYRPGMYFARGYCYIPQGTKLGSANLELQALGSKGKVLSDQFTLPSGKIPLQPGTWASVIVPFTLPEESTGDAINLRLILLLEGFTPDSQIYVDDLGIYRVN